MSFLSFLSDAVSPITTLIDELHTSDEEKGTLQLQFQKVTNEITGKVIALESQLLESKTSIIVAEAKSQSWIARNWRPITMLTFLFLVVMDSFGLLANPLAPQAWTLLQIGLGGYVVGRSAEKVAPLVMAGKK
tara:strand:+ start:96 stop:494 length:399 start_codon:yes stop_codon:yes gene_type:complete